MDKGQAQESVYEHEPWLPLIADPKDHTRLCPREKF